MSRSIQFADRVGAVAGVAFAVLVFLGVSSVDPQRGVSDQELQTWWADSGNRNGFVISMYTLLVACPLFLVFVSRLRMRLKAADAGGWADTVFASGVVATTALGICAIIRGVIASSSRFADEPLPGVDTLRFQTDLAYASWDLVILFAALVVAIVSVLVLVTRVLPRWIGVFGGVVALGCLILFAVHRAPLSLPLLNLWVLAMSAQLLRTPKAISVQEPAWQPMMSTAQS